MDFIIHVDAISMGLPILHFKGQVSVLRVRYITYTGSTMFDQCFLFSQPGEALNCSTSMVSYVGVVFSANKTPLRAYSWYAYICS